MDSQSPVEEAACGRARLLARSLARQEVRVSVALELMEGREREVDELCADIAGHARRLASAAGVPVPCHTLDDIVEDERHPAVVEAEQIVRVRAQELARRARRRRTIGVRAERRIVGLVAFAGFAAVGLVAAIGAGILPGDAVSRVAAAQSVLHGRDPHLEAVGFVWGPFPTLLETPLTAFRSWWPALTSSAVAAVLVSAAFMAGVLTQLVAWGRECGSPRWCRLSVVSLTAAAPLIWMYGANGMSEACWLFFLVLACRQLARWMSSDDVGALALCGGALGLAYLTRYESAAAILATLAVVAVVSWGRSRDDAATGSGRMGSTLVDVTVVAFPAVAAVVGWALTSWIIVGEPFAQFTSQYGNAALVAAAGDSVSGIVGDLTAAGRAWFSLRQVFVAAPLLVPLLLLALWVGDRAASRAVAAVAVLGSPVALQLMFSLRGDTFPWFRYVTSAVVLSSALALVASGSWAWVEARRWVRPVAVLALVPGVVLSFSVVRSGALGADGDRQFVDGATAALHGGRPPEGASLMRRAQRVARDIDRRDRVAPGAVLTDTSSTFAVVAAAPRPEVYVVPPDRDFEAVVADPATFGIRFVLLRGPAAPGDAVLAAHPTIWKENGAPIGQLVQTWGEVSDPAGQFRLYRVDDAARRTRPTPDEGFTS